MTAGLRSQLKRRRSMCPVLIPFLTVFAVSAVALAAQAPATPQPPASSGSIEGSVLDQTRDSIVGAAVQLIGESPATALSTTSDASGAFAFGPLSAGTYRIRVEKSGFQAVDEPVAVGGGNVNLPPVVLEPSHVKMSVDVIAAADYQVAATSTATRTPTLLLDIPQSIQSIPRRVIEEQTALSLRDVLRNAPGVSPSLGEGRRDQINIRGFSATNDEYIDGVKDDALYYRDLSNVETVDVLRGPAAVLFGRGSSGGLINRVTKKPDSERPLGELRVVGGNYSTKRIDVDGSQPWFDGQLAGRLTGAFEDSGSYRDFAHLERYTFSPALLWKPSDSTDILAQFDYLRDDRVPDRGIPSLNGAPAPVRVGAYYGYPEGDFIRSHVSSGALTLHHSFTDNWSFRNLFRETGYSTAFSNTFPNGTLPSGGGVDVIRGQYNGSLTQRNVFNQSEVTGATTWLGLQNVLLGGLELGHQGKNTSQFTGSADPVALMNPELTRPSYSGVPRTLNRFSGVIAGAYVQDQVAWRRWRVLLGVRRDYYDQNQNSLLPGVPRLGRTDTAWSPRAGIVYRLTSFSSLYASYSKTFDPSGGGLSLAVNNAELEPERTRNIEAGAKVDLLGGRLSTTASVFRLDRTNIKTTDPLDPTKLLLVGAQRTDGVELSLSGKVWRGLNVTGGYAFYEPLILRSNSLSSGVPIQGKIPALAPKRSGSIWATYFWQNGLGIGAGVFQGGRQFAANDNLVLLPGYARVDAALFYERRHWGVSATIRNVLNSRYYETAQSNFQIYPGTPVSGLVAVKYRW